MIEFPIVVFFRPAWEVFSLKCLSGMNIVNFFINRGVLWCLRMEILSRFLHDAAMLKSVVVKSFFYTLFMVGCFSSGPVSAGGGLVLEDDVCILTIDFYSAHFTAYQPETNGDTQFCKAFPDAGLTVIVLDYLHQSLKLVTVEVRIIKDVTGLGTFAKIEHVQAIENLDAHTVFYQPPVVRPNASLTLEHTFEAEGTYIGIITAAHPTQDTFSTAIFPFEVGVSQFDYTWLLVLAVAAALLFWLKKFRESEP